jgi:tetratricopeptide (TPR) repeat protein
VTLSIATLDGIGSLVDNSLHWRAAQPDGEFRFGMLETIREYALEQLAASGEAPAIQQRHAEFCLAFTVECNRHIAGPEQEIFLDRLETELDNMLSALTWSKADPSRIEIGLRLAEQLYLIWNRSGRLSEGRAWLTGMLAMPEAASYPEWRVNALRAAGRLATRQGDYVAATALLEESIAASRELGDKNKLAKSLWTLADTRRLQNDPEGALPLLEESLTLVRELGDNFGIGLSLYSLGDIALLRSDVAQAIALYKEGLTLHRQIANKRGIAHGLNGLGRAAQQGGDYEQAKALYEESLAISHDLKNKAMIAWLWVELGNVALQQDAYEHATTLYKQGLVLANELGLQRNIAEGLVGIAGVLGLTGQPEQAVQLFSQAERVLNTSGARLDPPSRAIYDDNIATLRARLSEADFARAWALGGAFTLEQAIAIALAPPALS